jgi:antitoxin component YwqK of YwqJK toxin-antitoxin module
MIQHEITINKRDYRENHTLKTVNRDLKKHRETGPAWREWYPNGVLDREMRYLNGLKHREDGPACRWWHENGNLSDKKYWLKGRYKGKFR